MKILIATAAKKLIDGGADSITLPTSYGETQILPGHTYLATELAPGDIVVASSGRFERFAVQGGLAEVAEDRVVALAQV